MPYENLPRRRVLVFGDSNTFGFDTGTMGRFGDEERYPRRLQALLGDGWTVLEEGLPGRTAVFDDPITEGLNGLAVITPLMMSHAPLDTLVIMLGTNDSKERFGCNSYLIAAGILRLALKAVNTPAWRGTPDVLLVAPTPIVPSYVDGVFHDAMGEGCAARSAGLAAQLEPLARQAGLRFLDAGQVPGVVTHPLDGMHLTREAHAALAGALAQTLQAGV